MTRTEIVRDAGYHDGFFASRLLDLRLCPHKAGSEPFPRLWTEGFCAGWADAHPSKPVPTIQESAVGTKLVRGK